MNSFCRSQKGKKKLNTDNFVYNYAKTYASGGQIWHCEQRKVRTAVRVSPLTKTETDSECELTSETILSLVKVWFQQPYSR